MDTEVLPKALQQRPLVVRAVEELKVFTQDEIERERYEARQKAQLDHNAFVREMKETQVLRREYRAKDARSTGDRF